MVALLQNNRTPEGPRTAAPRTRSPPPPPKRRTAYVTLKFDDNGCCRIHSVKRGEASVSDGDKEIVTNERYVVMPWRVVNRRGKNGKNAKNVTLEEAVHEIISYKESVDKEHERREIEHAEIERKRAEYYEAHMKSETERLNKWIDWYEVKLNETREAPVDSRLRMLERRYRISEKNKNCGVTITSAGVINQDQVPQKVGHFIVLSIEWKATSQRFE